MKAQYIFAFSCLVIICGIFPHGTAQGTGKVQEFFKKYFGEYFPKTTRSYTLYGNALNGPADFNAGLPVADDHDGPIKSIIIKRGGSPGRNNNNNNSNNNNNNHRNQQGVLPMPDNAWQPVQNFDPVAFVKGGHRGRSDLAEELDDAESRIITADDILEGGDDTREFRIESSMSFAPGSVHK